MTEITKSTKLSNLILWDIETRLYLIKDDIPIDNINFSIFIDYLEMYKKFNNFYNFK